MHARFYGSQNLSLVSSKSFILVKMFIALAAFYLSSVGVALELPTHNTTEQHAITTKWVPNPSTRGTGNILYSCVLTISLCVYTALHLNIPKQGTSWFEGILVKAKWVMVGIFAPEVVVYTGFVQLRTVYHFKTQLEIILAEAQEDSADQVANGQKIGESQPPGSANSEDVEKGMSTTQEVAVGSLRPTMHSVSDGIMPAVLPEQKPSSSERAPIDTAYNSTDCNESIEDSIRLSELEHQQGNEIQRDAPFRKPFYGWGSIDLKPFMVKHEIKVRLSTHIC